MRGRRTAAAAAALLLAGLVTSCAGGQPAGGARGETSVGSDATSKRPSACADLPTGGDSAVMVDWVDFVRLGGVQYVAGSGGAAQSVTPEQVGPVVGKVQCRLSALAFTQQPGPPVDGDAAFLPVGTQVHSVVGWSSGCRVTARIDGAYRLYVASGEGGGQALPGSTPAPCPRAS